MATCRAHLHRYPRYFTAFPFRLDEKPLPRSHFRCQRIHLGAHEAAFLPLFLFRAHSKPFFPPRISQLLVGEARRNFFWLAFNSRAILHSKRCVWKIPRLAEYPFFLHLHHRRLFFGILSFQARLFALQVPFSRAERALSYRARIRRIHFLSAANSALSRPCHGFLRNRLFQFLTKRPIGRFFVEWMRLT